MMRSARWFILSLFVCSGASHGQINDSFAAFSYGKTPVKISNAVGATIQVNDSSGHVLELVEALSPGKTAIGIQATNPQAANGSDISSSSIVSSGVSTAPQSWLSLGAFTQPGAQVWSQAYALQQISWDGTGSASRILSLNVRYQSSFPVDSQLPASDPSPWSIGYVWFSIFSLATPNITVQNEGPIAPGICQLYVGMALAWDECITERADFEFLGFAGFSTDGLGTSPLTGSLAFDLEEDRYVYLELEFAGLAKGGAYFDARHTIDLAFNDVTGLTAAPEGVALVPEPATLALLGLGLAGLGFSRRKQ